MSGLPHDRHLDRKIKQEDQAKMASIAQRWQQLGKFFTETKSELAKVSFPSRAEVVSTTVVVLISSLVFAFFLAVSDLVILRLYEGLHTLLGG
jgi:preprotein translocase subunit SecE